MSNEQKTCAERLPAQYGRAMHDLWLAYLSSCGKDEYVGHVTCEDGVEFDYEFEIEEGQHVDAYRRGILCFQAPAWKPSAYRPDLYTVQVQFSWGGPADGLLVELDHSDHMNIVRARYYFQDWWDYAERFLSDEETEWVEQVLWEYLENWVAENEDDLLETMREWGDGEEDEEEGEDEEDEEEDR